MTPLVEIHLGGGMTADLKLEMAAPAGSHKDRAAQWLAAGLKHGAATRAVLMSSGNMANAMAYYTRGARLTLDVITDALSPREFRDQLSAYPHVNLHVVDRPDANGSHMVARRELRDALRKAYPEIIEVDQYDDRRIPMAYEQTLFRELDAQTHGEIGVVFVPTGTGGLLNGVLKYTHRNAKSWVVIGVDAAGSKLHWTPPAGLKRTLSGYGNAGPTELIKDVWRAPYHYHLAHVGDHQAISACHWLNRRDGLFLGPSSGATVAAIDLVARHRSDLLPHSGRIAAIMPDGGGNYVSTLWNDDWLIANGFGKIVSSRI